MPSEAASSLLRRGSRRPVVRIAAVTAGALAVLLNGGHPAHANLVTNGSFEQSTAGNTAGNPSDVTNTNLTGWAISGGGGTPYDFVINNQANFISANGAAGFYNGYGGGITKFNFNPGPSPDGGNYIAANADDSVGTLSQTLGGLTPGAQYVLSFYEATTTTYSFGGFDGYWQVSFGGTEQNSTAMPTSGGSGTTWIMDTLVFTATNASQVLSFVAGETASVPPFILLDGVSVTKVPEPATLGLAGAGILGLLAIRRRRRSQRSRTD
jgi:hypothetical protein